MCTIRKPRRRALSAAVCAIAAAAGLALNMNGAAHEFHQGLADNQNQPTATALSGGRSIGPVP